jgi:hypothetical protein
MEIGDWKLVIGNWKVGKLGSWEVGKEICGDKIVKKFI